MLTNVKGDIRRFLEEDPFYQETIHKGFPEEMSLVDAGVMDSIGIFNLIIFLETRFQIKIELEELSDSNFLTLNHLEKFVINKIKSSHDL